MVQRLNCGLRVPRPGCFNVLGGEVNRPAVPLMRDLMLRAPVVQPAAADTELRRSLGHGKRPAGIICWAHRRTVTPVTAFVTWPRPFWLAVVSKDGAKHRLGSPYRPVP